MVYIDKQGKLGWSHLIADEMNELHEFAKLIGLKECWFQSKIKRPHYDVKGIMRIRAINKGAVLVSPKEIVMILRSNYQ